MSSLLGMELANEINRDRLAEAEGRRTAHLVRPSVFSRLVSRARKIGSGPRGTSNIAPSPVRQVGRARAMAPSAPMGCTA